MRDDRDIQRSKPASAPEKGRGPHCGKDRRSATVCPCRWGTHLAQNSRESVSGGISLLPTCHGIPAKACQVSFSASHLARYPRKSVPGVLFRLPPGTVSTQKCTRCPFPPPTWHGIPAKACQVSFPCCPPGTEIPQKRSRWHVPPSTWHSFPAKACQVAPLASHLAQFPCESVSGSTSCLPPGTVFPQKRVRCPIPPSTWHGNPAKACQVAPLASHLARKSRESVPGVTSCRPPATEFPQKRSRCHLLPPTCYGFPAKVCQVSPSAVHLARKSRESVPGVTSCRPPATEFPQKRSRCHLLPPTCYGFPAKVCQVSPSAVHLARYSRKSVPGVLLCFPPATESPQKRVRWHLLPSTCCGSSSHHGMLGFFSRACGCFQHEACNHQHTCSCGIHVSF